MNSEPWISIITAAYNAESTLLETVRSVLEQSDPGWELIIVDDGSADGTCDLATGCAAADGRISVISQTNSGTAAARNAGVRAAHATWLCMLDADDLLLPGFLERMRAFRDADPDYDIYSPATTMLLRDGRQVPLHRGASWSRVHSVSVTDQMWDSRIAQVSLMRREVFDRVGGYRPVYAEDYDFWLRALVRGARQLYDPEPLWVYRRQAGSKTTALVHEAESILAILTDARQMPELTAAQRAECDRAIAFARERVERRRFEEDLLAGRYAGARGRYAQLWRAFPGRVKYAIGFAVMMVSPRAYTALKRRRMV